MLYYILDYLKENYTDLPIDLSFYKKTEIHFNGLNCKKNRDTDGIFDILGYFSSGSPEAIFICHNTLREHCDAEKLSYAIVYDIICIHEYAHLIHYKQNEKKFTTYDLGFACYQCSKNSSIPYDTTCVNCHKYYVETWAQWLTYKICQKLDIEHESNQLSPYIKTFNFLSKGVPKQYDEYQKLLNLKELTVSDIIKLFLRNDGWLTDGDLLRKLHLESIKRNIESLVIEKGKVRLGDMSYNFYNYDWPYMVILINHVENILKEGDHEAVTIIYKKLVDTYYSKNFCGLNEDQEKIISFYDRIVVGDIKEKIKSILGNEEWNKYQKDLEITKGLINTIDGFDDLGIN